MDKILSRGVLKEQNIPLAAAQILRHPGKEEVVAAGQRLGYPLVMKTPCLGSSVGMVIAQTESEAVNALRPLLQIEERILCEAFLPGRELTCGVLDFEGVSKALPPTEIQPRDAAFFDYDAKYTPGASLEITPAPLSSEETHEMQRLALLAHEALGCRGYSRTDAILSEGGTFRVMELNTLPGLTPTSLFPQEAAAVGMDFCPMVTHLLLEALRP